MMDGIYSPIPMEVGMQDELVDILQAFLDSGYRGVKLYGIQELMQKIADERKMPIEVRLHRNVIYLVRTDEGNHD